MRHKFPSMLTGGLKIQRVPIHVNIVHPFLPQFHPPIILMRLGDHDYII